jgi:hypothetical protein
MFDMCVRLGEDICFRCNRKILSADEMSIEHKVAWLGSSNDLFWDLANIAFSHLSCNSGSGVRPHRKYSSRTERESVRAIDRAADPFLRERHLAYKRKPNVGL